MTLKDFLGLFRHELSNVHVSILLEGEAEFTDCVLYITDMMSSNISTQSDIFKEYMDLQVDYFTIIDCCEFSAELCWESSAGLFIYLKNEV